MTTISIGMPRLSDSMEEGTVVTWLKGDGETVSRGDVIAEIESDKATSEYETEVAGVLRHLVAAGSTLRVGATIAAVDDDSATPTRTSVVATQDAPSTERPTNASAPTTRPTESQDLTRPLASPVARRVAARNEIDLTAINGSGPRGRIMRRDVLYALETLEAEQQPLELATQNKQSEQSHQHGHAASSTATPANPGQLTYQVLSRAQQVIAKRMSESRATVPDFEVRTSVDALAVTQLRSELRATGIEVIPTINDFIVKAVSLALRETPRANAAHRGDHWELWERINIGIAVATEDGLLVPTLFDADQLSLGAIARCSSELTQKAREGRLSAAELSGGTFTISNLGMFGVSGFSAVIFAPQAAILSVGTAVATPVVRDGQIAAGLQLELGLTCDHRILYGADAARLLALVREHLENPLCLLVA
jgi:pyruvate dehydrogenase E2 component (dihydrolipoamide acetyltransferase)